MSLSQEFNLKRVLGQELSLTCITLAGVEPNACLGQQFNPMCVSQKEFNLIRITWAGV